MDRTPPSGLREAAVPDGRLARLGRLGSLAAGLAGGMLAEGVRRVAAGERPRVGELLLTPANARRVADQLAQLRGAAMKVGQLMSMDAGNLLPPEFADILARLREDARTMPMSQVVQVLETHWGAGWESGFERFAFTPVAAASIGQVHRARTTDGRVGLLDFGATRAYRPDVIEAYRRLMSGAQRNDHAAMDEAAQTIGYFKANIHATQREAVLALFHEACEPLRHAGPYDFGASDLARRIRDAGLKLSADKDMWHTPPADALFLHRKLGGLYLLAARLRARVDVAGLAARWF